MKPKTYNEYELFFKKTGRFIDGSYVSAKGYNDNQLKSKYNNYVQSFEKSQKRFDRQVQKSKLPKTVERDLLWDEMRLKVFKRDNYKCRLYAILTDDERRIFNEKIGFSWIQKLDPAHIFKVGSNPFLKYKEEFIVVMNRMSHSLLDSNHNPINGESISQEEIVLWWQRIVGKKFYLELEKQLKG